MSRATTTTGGGLLSCGMCGARFDPTANTGCSGCPMNDGCLLACCPKCGYSAPNTDRSRLARLAAAIMAVCASCIGGQRARQSDAAPTLADAAPTLADAAPGASVRVAGIDDAAAEWREHLQAYGISRGREVKVVQQSPVTVVRVDHVDLAFESRIARAIAVESPATPLPVLT